MKEQINKLREMGFTDNKIDINLLDGCLGDIRCYLLNKEIDSYNSKKELMTIIIKTSTGRCFNLEIKPKYTIEIVKYNIKYKEGIPPDQMILNYNGRLLEDEKSLDDYCIEDGDTITLIPKM